MEKIELNLNNPIFVTYLNVEGLSRQKAEEIIRSYENDFSKYSNITNWIVASDVSKIECIYDGKSGGRDLEISHLLKEINKRIDVLSNSKNFEDFKINIRNWRLNEIIENGNQEK